MIGRAAIPSLCLATRGSAWPPDRQPPAGQQWLDVDGRLVAWGASLDGRWLMHWPGLGTYRFGPFGDVEAFAASGANPAALQDSFVRGVLPVVLVAREHEALHGSAVLYQDNIFAFVARSGVGKSSLALGVAARLGMQWADDTVVLSREPGPLHCISLPFPPRVEAEARRALGLLDRAVSRAVPGSVAPLSRIYVLRRDEELSPDRPLTSDLAPAALFEHLLPHAHPFELGDQARQRRMIQRLLAVAGRVRGCEIRFAPSLAALPTLANAVARHIEAG